MARTDAAELAPIDEGEARLIALQTRLHDLEVRTTRAIRYVESYRRSSNRDLATALLIVRDILGVE